MEALKERHSLVDIEIRPSTVNDIGFVMHSWVRTVGQWFEAMRFPKWKACRSFQVLLLERLEDMEIKIACNPADRDQIFGYLVGETVENSFTIHFVYVKEFIRNSQIARRLIESCKEVFNKDLYHSYAGPNGMSLGRKFNAKFNPFHFFGIFVFDSKEEHHAN